MNEMTLSGLLRMGNSEYARENANFLIIEVSGVGFEPEIIINPRRNFEMKLSYYGKAYNENLELKANTDIKITKYAFVEDLSDYFI
jgi:hypothetical protein